MLHVTNGDSAGERIAAAGIDGEIMAWRDVLHEGPLPARLDAAGLRAERARFLAACSWGDAEAIEADMRARDERLATAQAAGEEIVLWFEHDLFDQLQLLQILDALDGAEGVHTVLTDRFLGAMDPAWLAQLFPRREPLEPAQVALAEHAWAAVRAPEPSELQAMLAIHSGALPHLGAALRRLLEELPAVGDGLSRTERQALAALAGGASTPVEVLHACAAAEEAAFLGDTWLWRRLAELGGGKHPLLRRRDDEPLGEPPPVSTEDGFATIPLELTDDGRAVLAGEADRAALVPVDRWVGGIHVRGPRPAWRWDRAAGRAVRG
jgi:Domain of unknown function (DUF1835)